MNYDLRAWAVPCVLIEGFSKFMQLILDIPEPGALWLCSGHFLVFMGWLVGCF